MELIETDENDQLGDLTEHVQLMEQHSESPVLPIYTLPVEILQRVFVIMIWGNGGDEIVQRSRRRVVMQVCSFWREAAIGTPDLWSTLSLSPYRAIHRRVMTHLDYERLKGSACDLVLLWGLDRHSGPRKGDRDVFLQLALARKQRWRSLTFNALDWESLCMLTKRLSPHSLMNLRSIHYLGLLEGSRANHPTIVASEEAQLPFVIKLCNAPSGLASLALENTIIKGPMLPSSLSVLTIIGCKAPWTNEAVFGVRCVDGLNKLACLQKISMDTTPFCYEGASDHRGILFDLPKLSTLSIRAGHDRHAGWLIDRLSCTGLRHLRLTWTSTNNFHCYTCPWLSSDTSYYNEALTAIEKKEWSLETMDIGIGTVYYDAGNLGALMSSLHRVRCVVINAVPLRGPFSRHTPKGRSRTNSAPERLDSSEIPEHFENILKFRSADVCPSLDELVVIFPKDYSEPDRATIFGAILARARNPRNSLKRLRLLGQIDYPPLAVTKARDCGVRLPGRNDPMSAEAKAWENLMKIVEVFSSWNESPFE